MWCHRCPLTLTRCPRRDPPALLGAGPRPHGAVGGQGPAGARSQLLPGQGEIQRAPGGQHDHPVHQPAGPAGQGHQHLLHACPVSGDRSGGVGRVFGVPSPCLPQAAATAPAVCTERGGTAAPHGPLARPQGRGVDQGGHLGTWWGGLGTHRAVVGPGDSVPVPAGSGTGTTSPS